MQQRLYRSTRDKIIGGVAGGLGEYFDIDPVLVRILFVVGALVGGWGVIAYIVCWIVIPAAPTPAAPPADVTTVQETPPAGSVPPAPSRNRSGIVLGSALIAIGVLFLADNFVPGFCLRDFWPALLVLLGAAILLRRSR